MSKQIDYFAYGSNMSEKRLGKRMSSAHKLCVATLESYELKFNKVSTKDGSGKCNIVPERRDGGYVIGVVFSIDREELPQLDRFEGPGYERRTVAVVTESGGALDVETYCAINTNDTLRPLDWYKEHVLRAAREHGFPRSYIAAIETVPAEVDSNAERRAQELSIYVDGSEGPPSAPSEYF